MTNNICDFKNIFWNWCGMGEKEILGISIMEPKKPIDYAAIISIMLAVQFAT